MPTIVRELQVDAIIEGSVIRASDTVRITAKLIRGTTGAVIWSKSYERDLRDVLALQSEVARAVSSEVGITLTPQEQTRLAITRSVVPQGRRRSGDCMAWLGVEPWMDPFRMDPRDAGLLREIGLAPPAR